MAIRVVERCMSMDTFSNEDWRAAAELYAFLGNSLLKPMNRTATVGLDPGFWTSIAEMFDGAVKEEASALALWASGRAGEDLDHEVQRVSVEFTHLFVGPPKPAVAPWESMHGDTESHVGFGEATHEMRRILRGMGLSVQSESNQYEDHMGIELLVASEMCLRAAEGELGSNVQGAAQFERYVREHPLRWMGKFQVKVAEEAPDGYFAAVLALANAMLEWHVALL